MINRIESDQSPYNCEQPGNMGATLRNRLLLISILSMGLTACESKKGPENDPWELENRPGYIDPLSKKEQKRIRNDDCEEYPHPACDEPLDGKWLNDAHCYVPNSAEERKESDILGNVYSAILADNWAGYNPQYCNPYSLNSNPKLHELMRARFLNANPEAITTYEVINTPELGSQITQFREKGDTAFGALQEDFKEIEEKCAKWDGDSKRNLLPGACLMAMDKKED